MCAWARKKMLCEKWVYGDSRRRETYPLPGSFKALKQRARAVLGVDCEVWHDRGAQGRVDAKANYRVLNEADFGLIEDDDVVILVDPYGRGLSLGSLFDDGTIYKRDYVKHPMSLLRSRQPESLGDLSLPDLSNLFYKTSYKSDYLGKQLDRPTDNNLVEENKETQGPFDGTSTYRDHYKGHCFAIEPQAETAPPLEGPSYRDYSTTHNRHYMKPNPLAHSAPAGLDSDQAQKRKPTAPWRPTEYAEEYVEKHAQPWNGSQPIYEGPGPRATKWQSTYRTDYLQPPHRSSKSILHYDPEQQKTTTIFGNNNIGALGGDNNRLPPEMES